MAKTKKIDYAKWKKIAWRFGRVFIGASLVSLAMNWDKVTKVEDLMPVLVVPALTAGFVAFWKALREYLASGDYQNFLHKLPV